MKTSEFRKVYRRLTEPTEVSANGFPIGTWIPYVLPPLLQQIQDEMVANALAPTPYRELTSAIVGQHADRTDRAPAFNSRPFTPVPKKR